MIKELLKQPSGLAWAAVVPAHWTVKKLGFLASLKSGDSITTDDIKDDGSYPVYGGNGLRGYTERFTHNGEYALIGRQGALCGNVNYAKGEFWASEHAVVVAPREEVAVRWLGELLRAMELNQYSVSAAQPGLSVETIAALKVPVPPLKEQRAIADYLDRETARLDGLVAAKERVLGLLAEKRCALMTRAVTRGLDPRTPLRDSGIPWLGEIPVHWGVICLKFVVNGIEQGWSPECYSTPAAEDEWGVLKAGCCNGGVFNPEENKALPPHLDAPAELEVKPGDVLMSRASGSTDLIGSAALVPAGTRGRLLLSDKTYRLQATAGLMRAPFLVAVLSSALGRTQVQRVISGAAGLANNISQSDIKEFLLPLPTESEQRAILTHIEDATNRLASLRSATERTLSLLKERRAALIAAAVTGRINMESGA